MKEIFGKRLLSARRQAGLSQDKLVALIDGGVTKTAIAKYERGEMLPKPEVIELLASKLGQEVDFFFRPLSLNITKVEFRAKAGMSMKRRKMLRETIASYVERYLELEQLLNISTDFENPLKDFLISSASDIEEAANQLHIKWALGFNPLGNVMGLLEDHGIRVIEMDLEDDMEGYSAFANEKYPVAVVRKGATTERRRLTALHELAHLLLQFDKRLNSTMIEQLCFRFAGAMLIPEKVFYNEFGNYRTHFSILELGIMKDKYGMSAIAFLKRAADLEVVSRSRMLLLNEIVRKDPMEMHIGSNNRTDNATRFNQLLARAIAEHNISLSRAAELAGLNIDEITKIYTDHA